MVDIKAKIAALKAEQDEIEASLAEQADDIAQRDALARQTEATEAARAKRRENDLERQIEAVTAKLGEGAKIEGVIIDGCEDVYVIAHNEKAFQGWQRAVNSLKKVDRMAESRKYAMALVQVWNGMDVTDPAATPRMIRGVNTTPGDALRRHLETNSAQATPITNAGARLAGMFAADRKSSG